MTQLHEHVGAVRQKPCRRPGETAESSSEQTDEDRHDHPRRRPPRLPQDITVRPTASQAATRALSRETVPRVVARRGTVRSSLADRFSSGPANQSLDHATDRVTERAACETGDRARGRRGGGVEERGLAAGRAPRPSVNGWMVFEDGAAQSMTPPRGFCPSSRPMCHREQHGDAQREFCGLVHRHEPDGGDRITSVRHSPGPATRNTEPGKHEGLTVSASRSRIPRRTATLEPPTTSTRSSMARPTGR